MEKIIVILGPTASGKTALSVALAQRFNGEIISADSMQIYKGMDIGTAKVKEEEKHGIRHHLIDIVEPNIEFSLADYLELADKTVKDILSRGKLPFIVGGTGLYISSFTDNIKLSDLKADPEYRYFLTEYANKNGPYALKSLLRSVDPESADRLYDNDVKRITRALEVFRNSGKTIGEFNRESRQEPRYEFLKIGLCCESRDYLYSRINDRVDSMIEQGLVEEAQNLFQSEMSRTASQAIGYRQLIEYFNGSISLDEAIESIKRESRRYAKRQLTWFKRDSEVIWHNIDTHNFEEILNSCTKHMVKFLKVCYNKE